MKSKLKELIETVGFETMEFDGTGTRRKFSTPVLAVSLESYQIPHLFYSLGVEALRQGKKFAKEMESLVSEAKILENKDLTAGSETLGSKTNYKLIYFPSAGD